MKYKQKLKMKYKIQIKMKVVTGIENKKKIISKNYNLTECYQ